MTTKRESKRILSVSIQRIDDPDADWSYLGEFSDEPKDYAIVHVGEYAGEFVDQLPCECCGHEREQHGEEDYAECSVKGCECNEYDPAYPSRGNTLRFFNSASVEGEQAHGIDEEIRKYALQDYERARTLGETWNFVGVKAEAKVQLTGDTTQTIQSGGCWGIESDSDRDHFRMVETDELDQLKTELHAIGFSKRAITAAFRDAKRATA